MSFKINNVLLTSINSKDIYIYIQNKVSTDR